MELIAVLDKTSSIYQNVKLKPQQEIFFSHLEEFE
jgi:hypothetical protein